MTTLTQPQLTALRAAGHVKSRSERFVDPSVIGKVSRILDQRGERWASEILGRDISRRSTLVPSRPYLINGETYTLIYADEAETQAQFNNIINNTKEN